MKSSWLVPLVLPAILLAGCNGSARRKPTPRKAVVRRDPALEARLAGLSERKGFKHTVARGETLYRLSRKYSVPVPALMAANPGLDPRKMRVGQTVVIPGVARAGEAVKVTSGPLGTKPKQVSTPDRGTLRYPVRSKYRAISGSSPGAQFDVASGTTVVSASKGRVVLATADLGGLGPTVMVDHGGGLITMYGQLRDYAVRPGQSVKRGEPLGRVGALGLLFRVYKGTVPRAPGPYIK
jgi:murein DD-endopeptidase MepM/ murein hydrolase activator NlpD